MKGAPDISIFLVDDDKMFLKSLEHSLQHKLKNNILIRSFLTGEECLESLYQKPDIVVLDYMLNSNYPKAMDGIEVLRKIKQADPDTTVIMISGQKKIGVAVEALKYGAFNYVPKKSNELQQIRVAIRRAIRFITTSRQMKTDTFITVAIALAFILIIAIIIWGQMILH